MGSDSASESMGASGVRHGARRLDDMMGTARAPSNAAAFTFDGRRLVGREGEPLLAALLAAGVRVLRTMSKSGEARGGYCLVGRCTDCAVVVDGRPNTPACLTALVAGMVVAPQDGLGPPLVAPGARPEGFDGGERA